MCVQCGAVEIEKSMVAPWPEAHDACGQTMRQVYSPAQVIYRGTGFWYTDVARFRSQMSASRFAMFEAQRDDLERRAKKGQLTGYEKLAETD